jgi:phosphomannomutase
MRVKGEVSKKQSVLVNSQAASEVIHLKQLRDSMKIFVPKDRHFSCRERKQLTEAGMASNGCHVPGVSRGFIGCKQVCHCKEG